MKLPKYFGPIVLIAAMVSVCVGGDVQRENPLEDIKHLVEMDDLQCDQQLRAMTSDQYKLQDDIIVQLKLNSNKQTQIRLAYLAGLYRFDRTCALLAPVIGLRNEKWGAEAIKGVNPLYGEFPVAEALEKIGLPSVSALIANLSASDDSLIRNQSIQVLVHILGKAPAHAAVLEALGQKGIGAAESERLRKALLSIEEK